MRKAENGTVRTVSKNLVNRGEARDSSSEVTTVLAKSGTTFSFPTAQDDGVGGCAIRHSERRYGMTGEKSGKRNGEN